MDRSIQHKDNKTGEWNRFISTAFYARITIELNGKMVIIYMYGRTVRTIDNVESNSVTIPRGNLPSGIYFIRIYSDDTFVKKVVIR
jgi:hypothetical protein